MITQLLTTALFAVSLNTAPKRAIANAPVTINITCNPANGATFGTGPAQDPFLYAVDVETDGSDTLSFDGSSIGCYYGGEEIDTQDSYVYFVLDNIGFDPVVTMHNNTGNGNTDWLVVSTSSDDNYTITIDVTGQDAFDYFLRDETWSLGVTIAQQAVVTHSVSFQLNHCTTATTYPIVVEQGQTFTATFTAMSGYAFKADNVAEYFDYPQGALNPIYSVTDYVGDFGSYWRSVTITTAVYADCTLTISPAPLDEGALQDAYDRGYNDAKTTYENTNQFSWLKGIWTGMATFFSIEILPNISLGFLAFAPLLVVAVVAIVRILKHD